MGFFLKMREFRSPISDINISLFHTFQIKHCISQRPHSRQPQRMCDWSRVEVVKTRDGEVHQTPQCKHPRCDFYPTLSDADVSNDWALDRLHTTRLPTNVGWISYDLAQWWNTISDDVSNLLSDKLSSINSRKFNVSLSKRALVLTDDFFDTMYAIFGKCKTFQIRRFSWKSA